MTERSVGGGSPDPRTGFRDLTIEDRLDALLVDLRDEAGNEQHVRRLEDTVSEAIRSGDTRTLVFVHAHALPASDRARVVNEGLYLLHYATEIALRGFLDKPHEDEYEQIARLVYGLGIELEPGGGGFAAKTIRPTILRLEETGIVRMDDDFGYQLTGLGMAHAELWNRDYSEIIKKVRTANVSPDIGRLVLDQARPALGTSLRE